MRHGKVSVPIPRPYFVDRFISHAWSKKSFPWKGRLSQEILCSMLKVIHKHYFFLSNGPFVIIATLALANPLMLDCIPGSKNVVKENQNVESRLLENKLQVSA